MTGTYGTVYMSTAAPARSGQPVLTSSPATSPTTSTRPAPASYTPGPSSPPSGAPATSSTPPPSGQAPTGLGWGDTAAAGGYSPAGPAGATYTPGSYLADAASSVEAAAGGIAARLGLPTWAVLVGAGALLLLVIRD